ncbi:MAG: hypothetical protein ABZF75_00020 [Columbia Basin potato purple top phytoplasma]
MLIKKQIELLQTAIFYQRPDLSKIMLPLIKIYQKNLNITRILTLLKIKGHLFIIISEKVKNQKENANIIIN